MFFLNLTAGEFFTLLGVVGGIVTALYLLDRSKRKKVVSTLRFWAPARTAEELQSRRRMREPWSLVLQLAGLALLLLAIGELQWGSRRQREHNHVLLLDTSAWSGARGKATTVLDEEKELAKRYLSRLPPHDRVILAHADALVTPVTPFTADRSRLAAAIDASVSQSSALNIEQSLSFASQARGWDESSPGEIAYVGPGLTASQDSDVPAIANLRVLSAAVDREDVGIRHLAAKRDELDAGTWLATVTLKNFGAMRHTVRLDVQFAGTSFTPRIVTLAPHEESAVEYRFDTAAGGDLVARIATSDSLAADNEARLRLPQSGPLRVTVFTSRAQMLKPLFETNHRLAVRFAPPAEAAVAPQTQLAVFDAAVPAILPPVPCLFIKPSRQQSPIAVKGVDRDVVIKTWHTETPLAQGLRAHETHLSEVEIFEALDGDTPVAGVAGGPIVIAREAAKGRARMAVIGFDPLEGRLKFEVTTPILLANLMRWLSPEGFAALDASAGQVGTASLSLDPKEDPNAIRISTEHGSSIPFTLRGASLSLFAAEPAIIRIHSTDRERILSLTLPDVGEFEWKPPADAKLDLPPVTAFRGGPVDLWKWLAGLGLACLAAEWYLYGRQRRARIAASSPRRDVARDQPELVAK